MTDEFNPQDVRQPGRQAKGARGTQTGLRAVRAAWQDARAALDGQKLPADPDPNEPRGGTKPGQWEGAPHDAMPPDCPVRVIGRDEAGCVYVLTATNDLRKVEKWDMPTIVGLFAPQVNYAFWAWPAFGKKKVPDPDNPGELKEVMMVTRLERDKLATCLINQASKLPIFDPSTQHRGRGGWRDKTERFIWHSGGWLWTADKGKLTKARPMDHDGFLYTRQTSTVEPWAEPVSTEESPAVRILRQLRTWKWERPYLDPVLCLGWMATAIMGGALKARPIVFTTGGAGVGKSTLHELFKHVLDGMVVTAVDTTAAGIYQRVKHDSLPVMIDELEAKPGSQKAQTVIELARVAYTGGDISRGGQDHEGTTFRMHNSFFFSAISPPRLGMQDRSRMALLNLRRLDQSTTMQPDLNEADGRMMLRQVMDGWADFRDRLVPEYDRTLRDHKLDSRAIDTYGTLLAAAELLVGPELLEDIGLPVTEATRLGEIVADATAMEREEQLDNWHECLNHLLQTTIDAWKDGQKPTVGGVLDELRGGYLEAKYARERLALVNCSIVDKGKVSDSFCLAIPPSGPTLRKLFGDTRWADNWFLNLKQAPDHIVIRGRGNDQAARINGTPTKCLLVDLVAFDAYAQRGGK